MPTITEIVETDSEAHDVRRAPQGVSPEEHRLARRMFLADVSDDDDGEVSGLDDLGMDSDVLAACHTGSDEEDSEEDSDDLTVSDVEQIQAHLHATEGVIVNEDYVGGRGNRSESGYEADSDSLRLEGSSLEEEDDGSENETETEDETEEDLLSGEWSPGGLTYTNDLGRSRKLQRRSRYGPGAAERRQLMRAFDTPQGLNPEPEVDESDDSDDSEDSRSSESEGSEDEEEEYESSSSESEDSDAIKARKRKRERGEREVAKAASKVADAIFSSRVDLATKDAMRGILTTLKAQAAVQRDLLREATRTSKVRQDLRRKLKAQAKATKAAKREAKEAKREAKRKRGANARLPKGLDSPTFPEDCKFDPDNKKRDDLESFLEKMDALMVHVHVKHKSYYLLQQLSNPVAKILRLYDRTRYKSTGKRMRYKDHIHWLRANYSARDAVGRAFAKMQAIKQGGTSVQSFVTRLQAAFVELEGHGHVIDKLSRRQALVNGLRAKLKTEALKWTDFYERRADLLIPALKSLDASLKESDKAANKESASAAISQKRFKAMEEEIQSLKSEKATEAVAAVDTRTDMQKSITMRSMKEYYKDEDLWSKRLKYSQEKGDPSKKPEYYKHDKYNGQKACIYCKKLGHTFDTCKAWKKKHGSKDK